MNENEKLETESQTIHENNKPWYKKKGIIATSSSILGAGVLAAVIAVPIAMSNTIVTVPTPTPPPPTPPPPTPPPPTDNSIQDAIKVLNTADNKDARATIWNAYMTQLAATRGTEFDKIIRSDAFIDQFINLLADNLYVTEAGTETGAISKADADSFKTTISNTTNKAFFKETTLATYTNLFDFSKTTAMFTFKDKTANETIHFTLTMPLAGLDLIYNDDQTITITTPNAHDATTTNIVQLDIIKFTTPTISTSRKVYFNTNANIKLPSEIMTGFPTYFDSTVKAEEKARTELKTSLGAIEKSINSDSTGTVGLSYWNSFALNYATSNTIFLKKEFAKETIDAGIYKFLAANAKTTGDSPVAISDTELKEIKTLVAATPSEFTLSTTPFVSSPSFSDLFFATSKTAAAGVNNYELELDITKFSYTFSIKSLFNGKKAIVITPSLELSGKLIKTSGTTKALAYTNYVIPSASYDVSNLIDMSATPTGGMVGFLISLADKKGSDIATLTKSLVALNSKTTADQISFWNTFATDTTNKPLILAEIQKADVLYNFINQNIDWTNPLGVTGKTFPTIVSDTLKTNINTKAATLADSSFNFDINGTAKISLTDVQWDSDAANKFTNISIYFGNETDSISKFNVTSTAANSNVSFSQALGASDATALATNDSIKAAAAKRFSIVFETSADAFVFYFGQGKFTNNGTDTQVIKPVIIPQTILTPATKFIDAIKLVK